MKINFIGSPGSGKTTLASQLFVYLKQNNYSCEFIQEQARIYIAKKKIRLNSNSVILTDTDQTLISINQLNMEQIFQKTVSPETIIVTDSSCINALFYMSKDYLYKEFWDKETKDEYINTVNVLFYVPPIENYNFSNDLNRVHNKRESKRIDKIIKKRIDKLMPKLNNTIIEVPESTDNRLEFCIGAMYDILHM